MRSGLVVEKGHGQVSAYLSESLGTAVGYGVLVGYPDHERFLALKHRTKDLWFHFFLLSAASGIISLRLVKFD
jgi:hypothetical protein